MNEDERKTRTQLIAELEELRWRVVELEAAEAKQVGAEEALRESEERYRTLIENQGEGVGIVDPQERFIFANPAAESIFGVPPGDLVGRNLKEFTDPEGFALVREQSEVRQQGKKSTYEVEIVRPDGERRQLLVTATPQFDSEGQFTGTFGVFRDITERVRAEGQIQAALAKKEVLLREIHHRVKNNLQALIYLIDMQAEVIEDARVLHALHDLQRRARAMALVHERLYQSEDLARVDLRTYLEDLTAHLFHAMKGNRDISLHIDAGDAFINVDTAIPWGLIVNELMSNALKYAFPEGDR